jgi:hypothetical protein
MPDLADMQDEFADALLSATTPVPSCLKGAAVKKAGRRFAVYRNNVTSSLIEALSARFPVIKRLVGDEFFVGLARSYVLREPPFSPLLIHYGETFPAFIGDFEPAKPLPYLADVARLEYARGRAYHAADAEPVPREVFAALAEEGIGATRVRLHPSVSILSSPYPVFSIWQANQAEAVKPIQDWGAETALVARPFYEVETVPIGAGIGTFLGALRSGATIADAAEAAGAAVPSFNPADGLATLIGQNLAVALV